MRVAQARGDVEPEVGRVLDDVLANTDQLNPALLESLLQQDRLEDRVKLLANIFQQCRVSKLDAKSIGMSVQTSHEHLARPHQFSRERTKLASDSLMTASLWSFSMFFTHLLA